MHQAEDNRVTLALWAVTLTWMLAGCAGQSERVGSAQSTVAAGEFGTPDCFRRRSVQDFDVLDDRNLIVFAPGKSEAYHIQVSPPVMELRFANALAFESRSSRICGYAGDSLLVNGAGPRPNRVLVTGVFRLDELALAGLQARFGKGAARSPAQGPQPGDGAVIERDLDRDEGD